MMKFNEKELKIIKDLEVKGFKLLEKDSGFLATNSVIKVICDKQHETEGIVNNLVRLNGCPSCKKMKPFYKLKSILEDYGYTVITKDFEYGGSESSISYKCDKGHYQEQRVRYIRRGRKCYECRKYGTYDKVVSDFISEGYTMITTRDEYIDTKTNVAYRCNLGHVVSANVSDLSQGNRCPECNHIRQSERFRTPKDLVLKEFHDSGYQVLNGDANYKNSSSVFTVNCPKGHEWKTSVTNFRIGGRCKKCANEKLSEDRRRPLDDVLKIFTDSEYSIVDNNYVYENSYSVFKVMCPEGHIYNTTVNNFNSGYRCNTCSTPKGEKHSQWKGGITPLQNHIRTYILPWKIDSFNNADYTCFITGSIKRKKLIVHHHKNFSDILSETLLDLNYDIKSIVNEYSKEEMINIEELCLTKHYKYGLGTVMNEDAHNLFHQVYSRHNNTMEQVLEFKKDYENGKYPELLNL